MEQQKRSKKFTIVAAVLILLVGIFIGGYLVLKSDRGVAGQLDQILKGTSLTIGECKPNPYDPDADSDNDGLKDWEEIQIYKTDPCNPDTDGDGYLDGEEVASGYDPTKKAPGDELAGAKSPRPLPGNLTEALRQKLAGQIATDKIVPFNAQGEMLSAEELENYPAIGQAIQEVLRSYPSLFAPDKIDDSQIKTSLDNSKRAIQNYATAAAIAFYYKPQKEIQISQSETEIFLEALENNNFSKLNILLENYKSAYTNLKELTVPTKLIPLHKEQLNILSSTIKIYQAIKEINSDPLKANLALQTYSQLKERLKNWLQELSKFIESHP